MIKAILPNARLLALPSENQGRDWHDCVRKIDSQIELLGVDLARESVFLTFNCSPESILAGLGHTMVARPIIGPKKELVLPFKLVDVAQSEIYQKKLSSLEWPQLMRECIILWEILGAEGIKVQNHFFIEFKKSLKPDLELELFVMFKV